MTHQWDEDVKHDGCDLRARDESSESAHCVRPYRQVACMPGRTRCGQYKYHRRRTHREQNPATKPGCL
jgi:hypothetical protein